MLKLRLLLTFIMINSICLADNIDDNTDNNDENNKIVESPIKIRKFKSGFYSGFDVGGVLKSLTNTKNSTVTDSEKSKELKIKKNAFDANLLIGYDKSFGQILIGAEFGLGKQFDNTMQYSVENIRVADISQNWNCTGLVKIGVVFGTWSLCGTVGGQLSSIKYKWDQTTHPDLDKQKKYGFKYGCILEKQFSNMLAIRVGYTKNNDGEHDNTNTRVTVDKTDKKLNNIKTSDHKLSLGFSYRF